MTLSEFSNALAAHNCRPTGNGSQVAARCPTHEDNHASLSVTEGSDGKLLVHCHAGCEPEAICAALGVKLADLFPGAPKRNGGKAAIETTYDYRDENRKLLFQVCRFQPKDFRQRRPDPNKLGRWIWKTTGVRRVIFRLTETLAAVQRGEVIHIAEGEKDVLALVQGGFAATCNPGGAGKWRPEYTATLKAAAVVIVADKDPKGREHAVDVAAKLQGVAASVKVIELPDTNGKPVKDAADFFAAGGTAADFKAICGREPQWTPEAQPPRPDTLAAVSSGGNISILSDKRPKVQLSGDNYLLSDCARAIGRILAPKDIFARGGLVFTVNDRKDGLAPMTAEILRTWVEDYLVLFKVRKLSGTDEVIQFKRTITETDAAGILASPQFLAELHQIERFNPIRVPVMRKAGNIELLPEGYDAETKSFTCDSVPVITGMGVAAATATIDELLGEFVFADGGRSKAVLIGAMLTVFARGLLPPKSLRPCFVFLANAEGAGKTLLVKCATVPVLGYAPAGTKPKDEDEMRKTLLAAILEARPVIFFDNVKKHVASAALEGFLTTQDYEGRILGLTKTFRGENNAVVFITGNGCTVSPDMRRRSLFCEVFLEVERAEDRVFQSNLEVPLLLERRSEILTALWELIQAWDKDMRPKPSRSNSSFLDWSKIIGGIVEHAGYGCPLETPQIEAAADQDGADMRALVKAIADGAQLRAVQFDEVVDAARAGGLFEWCIPPGGELEPKPRATFANLLKGYDRRLIGGYRFSLLGKGRNRRFQVEAIGK